MHASAQKRPVYLARDNIYLMAAGALLPFSSSVNEGLSLKQSGLVFTSEICSYCRS
jgi:hypothetical protein